MGGKVARRFFERHERVAAGGIALRVLSQQRRQAVVSFGDVGRIELQKGLVGADGFAALTKFFRSSRQVSMRRGNQRIDRQHTMGVLGDRLPILLRFGNLHQAEIRVDRTIIPRRERFQRLPLGIDIRQYHDRLQPEARRRSVVGCRSERCRADAWQFQSLLELAITDLLRAQAASDPAHCRDAACIQCGERVGVGIRRQLWLVPSGFDCERLRHVCGR